MLSESQIESLIAIVGPDAVVHREQELLVYECDGYTISKNAPAAVILPHDTTQTAAVLKMLSEQNIPVVPRGSGTSLAGGTLPIDHAVSVCTSRMNQILELDIRNRMAVVQAGVINFHISQHATPHGYHYAPDPSSQKACTIGGNIATNSGGPHTLKYGVTVNHVLGVTMVTTDGEIVRAGGRCEDTPGYDLPGILCGSEGTFGLVTEAVVRLTRNPEAYRTLLAVFESVRTATQTVSAIIAAGIVPAALEMMDALIIKAVEQAYNFGLPLDAGAVVIIELDGLDAGLDHELERVLEVCREQGTREIRPAKDESDRMKLWKCRKQAFGAIGRLAPSYCTQDAVVPRTKLPEVLEMVSKTAEKYNLQIGNVFHAGDGNIHPIILFDERDAEQVKRVLQASDEILRACVDIGGTVTGEHGIGVEKIEHLPLMFTEDDINVMLSLREIFNPDKRFNINKIFKRDTVGETVSQVHPGRKAPH